MKQTSQMCRISPIRPVDQCAIEPRFTDTGFVTRYEQDRLPGRIEREGDPPHAARGGESHFFHVAEPRSAECIDMRAPQLRPENFKHPSDGQERFAHVAGQSTKLCLERFFEPHRPRHDIAFRL